MRVSPATNMAEWPKVDWAGIRDRFTCVNRLYNQKSSLCRPWFRGSWMSLPTHEHAGIQKTGEDGKCMK